MANIKTMKHNTVYRVTKGNADGGIVAGDIVSYDSKCLVMWDGKYTGMYDDEDLSIPQISDFECELAEDYQLVKNQERISCRKITGNRMAEVAALFGKKLGEHFRVSCCNARFLLKFTSDGLCFFDGSVGHWNGEDGMLEALLTGRAVIVDE